MKSKLRELLVSAAQNLKLLSENEQIQKQIELAVDQILSSYRAGGTLYICGNGGSAADAQAMATELMVKLHKDRSPIRAIALTTDTSVLTAMGNDFGYEYLFHRQVKALLKPQDVLFAFTTSGNSPNVLRALEACKEVGARSVLLTGFQGGKAAPLADHCILAPGAFAGPIQECHLVIYHAICTMIEESLAEQGKIKYEASYPKGSNA